MKYATRTAVLADEAFLWAMLYYAAHMDESGETLASAKINPDLAPYVYGWGRADDVGVIGLEKVTLAPVGASWLRRMPAASPLYRFVAPAIPELAIAVHPDHLGQGLGSLMITELLERAATRYDAVVLSVRANNPARRLYERSGFTTVAEVVNRVGSKSLVMTARLERA